MFCQHAEPGGHAYGQHSVWGASVLRSRPGLLSEDGAIKDAAAKTASPEYAAAIKNCFAYG